MGSHSLVRSVLRGAVWALLGLVGMQLAAAEAMGGEQAPMDREHAPMDHEQLLVALASGDVDARRAAAVELGRTGQMADVDVLLEALFDADEGVRNLAEGAVWRVWSRSGDAKVDALLESGIRNMDNGRMGAAVDDFTRVIQTRPEFAEGWNKRATAYYLMGDLEQSLHDCDEVVQRNPHHFGALSGYGLIYVQRGELERALEYFERALAINPNMQGVQQSIDLIQYRLGKQGKRSI
jgi:tetratricopeptide (TPR) repeat protein